MPSGKNVVQCTFLGLFFLFAGVSFGQTCDQLNSLRSSTYNFHPAKLTEAERNAKSQAMDRFWSAVKRAGPQGVTCLQQMLVKTHNDPYFAFDGSSLLVSLKDDHDSLMIVQRVLLETSLDDVDAAGYVRLLLHLSMRGDDIGELAHRYMVYPNVVAYVPEHAMKLDRLEGAILLYGSMPIDQADKYLAVEVEDKEPASREVALEALSLNLTDASFRLLKSTIATVALSKDAQQFIDPVLRYSLYRPASASQFTRAQVVRELQQIPNVSPDFPGVAGNTSLEESASDTLTAADLPLLHEARRKSIQGVSDESLDEYFALSKIMLNVINRFDLYRDFRNP